MVVLIPLRFIINHDTPKNFVYTNSFSCGERFALLQKKLFKEDTTVEWVVINPVTNTPYVGVPVKLFLEYYGSSSGIKGELLFEGGTIAEVPFVLDIIFYFFTNLQKYFCYLQHLSMFLLMKIAFHQLVIEYLFFLVSF